MIFHAERILHPNTLPIVGLFHRHALGQVSGLVDIEALRHADIIREELQGNDGQAGRKMRIDAGDVGREIHGILDIVFSVGGDAAQVRAAGLALDHVGESLLVELVLGEDADDQRAVLDEADGAVLEFPGSIGLAVDVADLLELKAPLEADGIVDAAADEEGILRMGILCGEPLDAFLVAEDLLDLLRNRAQIREEGRGVQSLTDLAELQGQAIDGDELRAVGLGRGDRDLGPARV